MLLCVCLQFILYQQVTDFEARHTQRKPGSRSHWMEKMRGDKSPEPCPKLLRLLYLFHKHCVVREPAHRAAESLNEMISIGQKLLFPPILPSEAQPRLVRVYWRVPEPY